MLVSRNVDKRLLGSLSNDDDDAEDDTLKKKNGIYILQAKFAIV